MTGMHARFCRAIDYDGGGYGVGLLSRDEPLAVRRIPLPGREEARVLLMAEFPGYVVCVTHLSLRPKTSARRCRSSAGHRHLPQTRAAGGRLQHGGAKTVLDGLGGDIPAPFGHHADDLPVRQPSIRIDYILGRGLPESAVVTERQVDTSTVASDHCPLWVSLVW